jgi:hypothetical protein
MQCLAPSSPMNSYEVHHLLLKKRNITHKISEERKKKTKKLTEEAQLILT